jgi:uncharacterized protein YndB with AHSA1/START domain
MTNNTASKVSIKIDAPASKIWDALTNPEIIKQYLFGTDAKSDWKKGSTITYNGIWEGKPYEDHGVIVEIIPEKLLSTKYWSQSFGKDLPENYKNVIYNLEENENNTILTISQDGNKTEEEKNQSEKNWTMILQTLKTLLEK